MTEELHTYYCKDCFKKQEQIDRLEQENKELKEKVKSLESEIRQKKMTIMMNNDHYLTVDENNRNYRSALEEIRELAKVNAITTCWSVLNFCDECKEDCEDQSPFIKLKEIVDKIDEVLG